MNELLKFGKVVTDGLFCLLVAVMLTGCSKTDNDGLLDGKQPMMFTATVDGLTVTRATTGKDTWAQNDEIAVSTNADGSNHQVYQIANATTGAMSPKAEDNTLYWQQNTGQPITAWYPAATVTDADISNQSAGWADFDYLVSKGSYNFSSTGVQLSFTHAMAKVKITLQQGEGITTDELKTAVVRVYGYTLALFDKGVASASSNQSNREIIPLVGQPQSPISYEAIVIPQQMQNQKFIKVTIGGNDYFYTPTNNNDANFEVGKQYTYNITVQKNGLTVTASGATEWTGTTSGVASYVKFSNDELKIGDYYYSDGTTSDGGLRKLYTDGTFVKEDIDPKQDKTVIGIVLKVGRDADGDWKDDCSYFKKGADTLMDNIQGYVLALYDAKDANSVTWSWGTYSTQITHADMNREKETGFYGYKNTNAIKAFAADQKLNFAYAFPAAYNASEDYEGRYSAPNNSSGWFLPSGGQCKYWLNNRDVLLESVRKATGNGGYNWQNLYWSSSENSSDLDRAWYLTFYYGYIDARGKDYNSSVRSVLAF